MVARKFKRGLSLVEVVVSLTIVATVFATTVTLIISAYNLAISSRNLTEAVAISQKTMSELIEISREGCGRKEINSELINRVTETTATYEVYGDAKGVDIQLLNPSGTIDIPADVVESVDFEDANFVLFTVTAKWEFRNRDYEYEIYQIVQK